MKNSAFRLVVSFSPFLAAGGVNGARLRGQTQHVNRKLQNDVPEQVCNNGDGIGVEMYNIKIFLNPLNENEYLSANNIGPGINPSVTRSDRDDESGRQKWRLLPIPDVTDTYHIVIAGGIDNADYVYLSYPPTSALAELNNEDDRSLRQRWIVKEFEGGEEGEMSIQAAGTFQSYLQAFTRTSLPAAHAGVNFLHNVEVFSAERPRTWRLIPTGCNSNDVTTVIDLDDGDFGDEPTDSDISLPPVSVPPIVILDPSETPSSSEISTPSPTTTLITCPNDLYHIAVAGGTSGGFGGEQLLSATDNGLQVDLYSHDDNSGRQRWFIRSHNNDVSYTIQVSGGTTDGHGGGQYLSANENGSVIDLFSHIDSSGRQLWNLVLVETSNRFVVEISGGVTGGILLTADEDGYDVILSQDVDLERQEWIIDCI